MLEVILDTSALIAFFVGSEKHHKAIHDYFFANPKTRWVIISTVFIVSFDEHIRQMSGLGVNCVPLI
ncbi:hypothetical protein [Phormidium tenue]|uniref:PIN domain-containing protein n=1 Tax=Phormidium tenue FACHB-1050 TaxID=2692857 RepID=A0ABR8CG10_9CYAN|nr:hypothetical protein [Phormidium tenue]MBD2318632.1 hypothetical protein [Phormidium tenue FACHB-1050]